MHRLEQRVNLAVIDQNANIPIESMSLPRLRFDGLRPERKLLKSVELSETTELDVDGWNA